MKNRLRICLMGSSFSIHTQRIATSLAERGHDVHVLSLCSHIFKNKNVTLHFIPPHIGGENRFISLLLRIPYVKKLLKSLAPDVVLSIQTTDYGLLSGLTKGNFPIIAFAIGSDVLKNPFIYKNRCLKDKLKAPIWRFVNKIVFDKADIIVAEPYASFLIKRVFKVSPERLHTLIWGADDDVFKSVPQTSIEKWRERLGILPGQPTIISSRSMKELYRISTIVRSIPLVRESIPDVVFIFLKGVADPVYYQQIKEIISDLTLWKNVRLIDEFLQPQEVAALFHLSEILVSIPESDSFPLTALEGGLCNCIPILSEIPANRTALYMGLHCFFVNGDCEQELANKIIKILKMDETQREKIKAENKQWVITKGTWKATIDQVEKIIHKLAKG